MIQNQAKPDSYTVGHCPTRIYLIITTSIENRYGLQHDVKRKDQYISAISETLKHVPSSITPIIVENNGLRETYLDHFYHGGYPVRIIYTNNNFTQYTTKGANELLDLQEVIRQVGIKSDDMIMKLTGRYTVLSPSFFEQVMAEPKVDAFVKFFGACSLKTDLDDCILGLYAIRCKWLQLYSIRTMQLYKSAEEAFARYVRICGAQWKKVDHLDLECVFADDFRVLRV